MKPVHEAANTPTEAADAAQPVEAAEQPAAERPEQSEAPDQPAPAAEAPPEPAQAEPVTEKPAPKRPTRRVVRTPAASDPVPMPDDDGQFDLRGPDYFLNRELTWLNFNFRVLHEAEDVRTPLLERVKFVAIVSSNLDEFFMKRIGGLKQQVGAGIQDRTVDGRTPQEQIDECLELVRVLEERKRVVWRRIVNKLIDHDIRVTSYKALEEKQQAYLRDEYLENIYPLVTPQATDPAHPFPFISNLSLNLLVALRYPNGAPAPLARVKVPVGSGIPRFMKLKGSHTYVPMEDVMVHNLDLLFPGMEVDAVSLFRVTRNANTEQSEEHADDLLNMIESELRERRFAPIVRMEVQNTMRAQHRGMLAAELGLDEQDDVFAVSGMQGMRDLMEIAGIRRRNLHDKPHHPVDHDALVPDRSIFYTIRDAGSILLFHPFQSYATSVERFLKEASLDPKVRALKVTLYRTSSESKIIDYLIDAARNGKQVAVVVELKARFDEAANIRWASRLEEAGIHVTYGVVGLKTHCKVILIVRQDYDGLRRYAHVGTGNYHAGTARQYSDIGLLTCAPNIGRDLTELLNFLTTGFKPKRHYERIIPSPKLIKQALLQKIDREIEVHTQEDPGLIQIKTNALEDADVTRALYRASQAGVRVELIVRDSCRLRAGIEGLSESCTVISIVGRFLEHARVYYFRNGGDEEYYIGSADCMKRNLESRVEALVSVEKPELRKELRHFMKKQVSDHRSAWEMQPDGSYVQRRPGRGRAKSSQQAMIEWAERRVKKKKKMKNRRPRRPHGRNLRA